MAMGLSHAFSRSFEELWFAEIPSTTYFLIAPLFFLWTYWTYLFYIPYLIISIPEMFVGFFPCLLVCISGSWYIVCFPEMLSFWLLTASLLIPWNELLEIIIWSLRLCIFIWDDIMGQEFLVAQLLNVNYMVQWRRGFGLLVRRSAFQSWLLLLT